MTKTTAMVLANLAVRPPATCNLVWEILKAEKACSECRHNKTSDDGKKGKCELATCPR